MKLKAVGVSAAILGMSVLPLTGRAVIIGIDASATMSSEDGNMVGFSQFSSPVTVGPGVEFTGVATDTFGQVWDVTVDIADNSFIASWTERTRGTRGNVANQLSSVLVLDLSFAEPVISTVSLSSFTTTGEYAKQTPSLTSLSWGPSSIHAAFEEMGYGDVYVFNVSSVPEPETYALALVGLGMVGWLTRRHRAKAS